MEQKPALFSRVSDVIVDGETAAGRVDNER